jgi:hypothetical protein
VTIGGKKALRESEFTTNEEPTFESHYPMDITAGKEVPGGPDPDPIDEGGEGSGPQGGGAKDYASLTKMDLSHAAAKVFARKQNEKKLGFKPKDVKNPTDTGDFGGGHWGSKPPSTVPAGEPFESYPEDTAEGGPGSGPRQGGGSQPKAKSSAKAIKSLDDLAIGSAIEAASSEEVFNDIISSPDYANVSSDQLNTLAMNWAHTANDTADPEEFAMYMRLSDAYELAGYDKENAGEALGGTSVPVDEGMDQCPEFNKMHEAVVRESGQSI